MVASVSRVSLPPCLCYNSFTQTGVREVLIEIGLYFYGRTLEEDKSADCGYFSMLNLLLAQFLEITHGLMHKIGYLVLLQPFFHLLHFTVVNKDVRPCGSVRLMTLLYRRTSLCVWLCNVVALWRNKFLVGCRKRTRTIRFHKFYSTLCP